MFLSFTAQADVSMDDIEAVLEIELSAALREEFKLMLKTYNRDRGNKAISMALLESSGVAAGMGYKAQSKLTATNLATQQSTNWVK